MTEVASHDANGDGAGVVELRMHFSPCRVPLHYLLDVSKSFLCFPLNLGFGDLGSFQTRNLFTIYMEHGRRPSK